LYLDSLGINLLQGLGEFHACACLGNEWMLQERASLFHSRAAVNVKPD